MSLEERKRLGNEGCARALAAALPVGHVGVAPTLSVAGMAVRDGWCVAYTSPDGSVQMTAVYFGAGALRAYVEFGAPPAEAETMALAAVNAALVAADE